MGKRIFDLCFSLVGLIILSPLLVLIGILIRLDSRGPVFFRQTRVGRFGVPFKIVKFRTMINGAEKVGPLISKGDDPRITKLGNFLRRYKLDEIPQLLNVVSGEMSLVGPRPEVPKYVEAFRLEYEEILKVRPGITDFASLEFKNENDLLKGGVDPEDKYLKEILPEKIIHYRNYIREQSIGVDLKILLRTVWGILR
jgi:lipopolysaccharide/colanic/teichoic acid biosynthesis glycosyltransferase